MGRSVAWLPPSMEDSWQHGCIKIPGANTAIFFADVGDPALTQAFQSVPVRVLCTSYGAGCALVYESFRG